MSRREQRRAMRVDLHRKKKWDQITDRKALFLEMTYVSADNLLDMMSNGLEQPTGFIVDRDLDDSDYMFNTEFFKTELARYLATIVAVDAEYQDPPAVDALSHLVENNLSILPLENNLNEEVIEACATLGTGEVITVSENNIKPIVCQDPPHKINLAGVYATTELPPEMQLKITNELSCAEKIFVKACVPEIAVEPCKTGVSAPKIKTGVDPGPLCDVALEYPSGVHEGLNNAIRLEVVNGFCSGKELNYYKPTHYSKWFDEEMNHRNQERRKRGCICNTILFKFPSLLRERSVQRALTMTGVGPPRTDHICLRVISNN